MRRKYVMQTQVTKSSSKTGSKKGNAMPAEQQTVNKVAVSDVVFDQNISCRLDKKFLDDPVKYVDELYASPGSDGEEFRNLCNSIREQGQQQPEQGQLLQQRLLA